MSRPKLQVVKPSVFTLKLASSALLRNFAESFLGRPAKDQAELDAMCYRFSFVDGFLLQSGYNDTKANIRDATPTDLNPTANPLTESPLGIGKFKIEKIFAQTPGSYLTNQCIFCAIVIPLNMHPTKCSNFCCYPNSCDRPSNHLV